MKPGKKAVRSDRMKAVEREFRVAEMALEALQKARKQDSALLTAVGLDEADLRTYRKKLQDTYFIRLFAEFETGLKDSWKNGLGQDPMTRIMDVIDSIASRHGILDAWRINVHAARRYRNHLIHEEDTDATPVTVTDARRYLGRFISELPNTW